MAPARRARRVTSRTSAAPRRSPRLPSPLAGRGLVRGSGRRGASIVEPVGFCTMLWLLPLACAVVGLVVLAWLSVQVRREADPFMVQRDLFGRRVRPAVVELRRESAALRRRLRNE